MSGFNISVMFLTKKLGKVFFFPLESFVQEFTIKPFEYVICFVGSLYRFNFFNICKNIQIFYYFYVTFGKLCFSGICLFHYIFKFIVLKFFIILSYYFLNICRISGDILFLISGIGYLCYLSF